MSSISSASSSTTVSTSSSRIDLRSRWSTARPGVATMTSTPRASAMQLRRDRLAAVDGYDPRPDLAAVLVGRLGDLHRELAGRRQHQRPGPGPAIAVTWRAPTLDGASRGPILVHPGREALEQRQGERGGLAGAGRRLGEQVAAGEERRDRRGLDRGGLLVSEPGQRLEQPAVEPEGRERRTRRRLGLVGARLRQPRPRTRPGARRRPDPEPAPSRRLWSRTDRSPDPVRAPASGLAKRHDIPDTEWPLC